LAEIFEESLGKGIAYIYIDDIDRKNTYLRCNDFANIQVGKDETKKNKRWQSMEVFR
jgi:hypothetical protein